MSDEMGYAKGFEPVGVRKMTLKPADFDVAPHTCENCKYFSSGACQNGVVNEAINLCTYFVPKIKGFGCNQWEAK